MDTIRFELECKKYTYDFLLKLADKKGLTLNELLVGMINNSINQSEFSREYFDYRHSYCDK